MRRAALVCDGLRAHRAGDTRFLSTLSPRLFCKTSPSFALAAAQRVETDLGDADNERARVLHGAIRRSTAVDVRDMISEELALLEEQLADKDIDLNGVLSTLLSVPKKCLSTNHLLTALKKRADTSSLFRITPLVLSISDKQSRRSASFLIAALLGQYGQHRMIAAVPNVLDHVQYRTIARVGEQSHPSSASPRTASETIWAAHRVIASLWRFSSDNRLAPNRSGPLPPSIQQSVYHLVNQLLGELDNVPGPSHRKMAPALPLKMRLLLLSKRFVTPQIRELVLAHARSRGLELSEEEWRLCAVSAMREGKSDLVEFFLQEKQLASARESVSSQTPETSRTDQALEDEPPSEEDAASESGYDAIMRASASSTTRDVTSILQPFLITNPIEHVLSTSNADDHPSIDPSSTAELSQKQQNTQRTAAYAWSTLFHKLSSQLHIPTEDIQMLHESLSSDLFLKETITPLMKGLVLRGELQAAWDLWQDLAAMEAEAAPTDKGKWVDRVVLSVATELCYAVHGLPAAVELVDKWARRASGTPTSSGLVILDAWNINTLLHICRLAQSPSVAFRLWAAAYPRWGVKLDDISLSLLLDVARFNPPEEESVGSRLRALAHTFLRSKTHSDWDEYDTQGFASGGASVLLDPPGYTWASQHGDMMPWQRAKEVFEDVILGNWPHFRTLSSPLALTPPFPSTSYSWTPPRGNAETRGVALNPMPQDPPCDINAKYTHIVPSAGAFHAYIGLLARYRCEKEIPMAFAWSHQLGVRPHWETMRSGLLSIGNVEGPRRRINKWGENGETKLVRDEEIMRRWLQVWLDHPKSQEEGRSAVPTEQDVAEFSREITKKFGESAGAEAGGE